jgi:hypothetical protein
MNEFGSLQNTKLAAIQFGSESDFDKSIDLLLSKQEPFEVVGFDALIIPAERLKRAQKILHAAGLDFSELSLGGASLSDPQERNASSRKRFQKAS